MACVSLSALAVLIVVFNAESDARRSDATRLSLGSAAAQALVEHADPAGRFTFTYPSAFGTVSLGTNDGFGTRTAALRFSTFSAAGIGGEAVLTTGRPLVDVQAVGGLYDSIAREALSEKALALVDGLLPTLNAKTFCAELARETHIDVTHPSLAALPPAQREALSRLDRMGNVEPRVVECAADGEVVRFHKEAAVVPAGPRRHVFGAVRFLDATYSSFQIVQARQTVDAATVGSVAAAVASWRSGAVR